MQLFLTIKAL